MAISQPIVLDHLRRFDRQGNTLAVLMRYGTIDGKTKAIFKIRAGLAVPQPRHPQLNEECRALKAERDIFEPFCQPDVRGV